MQKRFDSKPSYDVKYLKTKSIQIFMIMEYLKKIVIVFVCLFAVLMDSVFKMSKNYYLQVFLEEYKYIVKEKMTSKCINDELEI